MDQKPSLPRIRLKGTALTVDNITIGMYIGGKLLLDQKLVLEGVFKDIEYKMDWNLEEVTKLFENEMDINSWKMFKLRRGLIAF